MQNYKVLLVEDEESLRMVYSEYLKSEGFDLDEASDGETALKMALEDKYDLILLDIMLPKMDGLEVLKKVRQKTPKIKAKIYLLTVLGRDKVITEAFELGADGYFIKDKMTPEDIKKEVLAALSK